MAIEMKPADNERWLTDGNCGKCRRQKYCSKPCTAQKRRKEAIIRAMVRDKAGITRIQKLIDERRAQIDEGI